MVVLCSQHDVKKVRSAENKSSGFKATLGIYNRCVCVNTTVVDCITGLFVPKEAVGALVKVKPS